MECQLLGACSFRGRVDSRVPHVTSFTSRKPHCCPHKQHTLTDTLLDIEAPDFVTKVSASRLLSITRGPLVTHRGRTILLVNCYLKLFCKTSMDLWMPLAKLASPSSHGDNGLLQVLNEGGQWHLSATGL